MSKKDYKVIGVIFIAGCILGLLSCGFTQVQEQGIESLPQRPNIQYTADAQRDPFQGPLEKAAPAGQPQPESEKQEPLPPPSPPAPPSLTIQGIVWGGTCPQAIINNKVVKVGDTIQGAEITKIGKEGVTISYSGVEYTLSTQKIGGKNE